MSEETKTTENKNNDSKQRRDNNNNNDDRRDNRRQRRNVRRTYYRKKECRICKMKVKEIDYKDVDLLRKYTTEKGKIVPRRMSGNCAKCQRKVKRAVKKARNAALLPFTNS